MEQLSDGETTQVKDGEYDTQEETNMTDQTPSRLGQINAIGDDKALFLKIYGGEVLTAFTENTVSLDKHIVRTIQHGKSAQFPATWKAEAFYHKPGKEVMGQQIKHGERVIAINDLLISPVFVANIDEAMNHYDVRSIYTKECGAALARHFDRNVLKQGILAARETKGTIDTGVGGKKIEVTDPEKEFVAAIFQAAQTLDEKDVPASDRYLYVKPERYYKLVQNTTVLNKDWGGAGSYSDGKVLRIAGIQIVETNNLPSADLSKSTDASELYKQDFSKTLGLIMHKTGVGTVKLLELATESDYLVQFQGTLTVAKMAIGHGTLRPEACIELAKT